VTSAGASIAEIQMYDHDADGFFAMLLRMDWPGGCSSVAALRADMKALGRREGLSIRIWSPDERQGPARLALCVTHRLEPPVTILRAIQDGQLRATPAVMIGNRPTCRGLAEQFGLDWHCIGDSVGNPDNQRLGQLLDQHEVDYIVLARYMRDHGSSSGPRPWAPGNQKSLRTLQRFRLSGASVFVAGLEVWYYLQLHCFSGKFRLQSLGVVLLVYWILGALFLTRERTIGPGRPARVVSDHDGTEARRVRCGLPGL
jgi:hypothetical protein